MLKMTAALGSAVLLSLFISGCGLKYDLYMPDEENQAGASQDPHQADSQLTLFSSGEDMADNNKAAVK